MEIKKIATRDSYGKALLELAREHDNVVALDADLAESTRSGMIRKDFPERFFDCGIAEANMVSAAAGMATTGLVPFVSSFAMFATGRAFEQIRNAVGYPHLNVKICASHAGISVGEDGATHQCLEDIALMRTIPGMVVMCPSDDVETRKAVQAAYEYQGPVYIRTGRLAVPVFHEEDAEFKIGKGEVIHEGNDITIVATGLMVEEARQAALQLEEKGISCRVINICTIKPIDEEILIQAAKETGCIVTAEEHNIIGGLGEAVAAVLAEKYPCKVKRVGVEDKFGTSGPAKEVLELYGLCASNLVKVCEEALK